MNNYPEYVEIKGKQYKINTDFKVAIKCNQIATDKTIGEYERPLAIIYTLFGDEGLNDVDNYESLLNLAIKYLSCGKEIKTTDENKDMDYIQDYGYVWASIYSDYHGLDIDKEKIHWWKFNELMNGLSNSEMGNCCILNRIRNLRNMDISDIKDEKERNKIIKAKNQVALIKEEKEITLTDKQKESVDEFYKALGF